MNYAILRDSAGEAHFVHVVMSLQEARAIALDDTPESRRLTEKLTELISDAVYGLRGTARP